MIYLDNAATTRISEKAVVAMEPYLNERYGNPSGIYNLAKISKKVVEDTREKIANAINAKPENIFFTSGGTESDNWVLDNAQNFGRQIITSKIEHHAILNKCASLEKKGMRVSYIGTDRYGMVNPYDIESAIDGDTALISVMFANNEVGTIDVEEDNIDLLSASSHKFHGPKGVGFLYVRNPKKMQPFIYGGSQERSKRAGTENVVGIVGMGAAVQETIENLSARMKKERNLRDYLIERVLGEIPCTRLNGHPTKRLPGNANFTIAGIDGTSLVVLMDNDNICVSSGSACSAGNDAPSHVIKAIGIPDSYAYGTIRITLCADNTKEEIDYTISRLKENVKMMREQMG